MSYAELSEFVAKTSGRIIAAGVGSADKVAIVLPNGPEAATAFLAVANCATAAPLNPAYKLDEFTYYLKDLNARMLLCADANGPAANAARGLGIAVAVVTVRPDHAAGAFDLDLPHGPARDLFAASPDDIALVLHTSGTTSRPKLVPLTHRNVCASGRNVAAPAS